MQARGRREAVGAWRVADVLCRRCATAGSERKPHGYWEAREHRRQFVDELRAACNVQQPQDWRKVTYREVCRRGGAGVLHRFGTVAGLLADSLPASEWAQVGESAYVRHPRGHWERREVRQDVIRQAAQAHGMDVSLLQEDRQLDEAESAAVLSAWRSVPASALQDVGASGLLKRYNGSKYALLKDSFRLASVSLPLRRRHIWASLEHRRRFLLALADSLGIDGTQAEAWKQVQYLDVVRAGGKGLLNRYSGSVFRTLQATFPEMDLSEAGCRQRLPRGYWDKREHRQRFLADVAAAHNIGDREGWRRLTTAQVREMAGGTGFLMHYGNRIFDAMRDLLADDFPGETWERSRWRPTVPPGHWQDEANVKAFLAECEAELQVEQPQDWQRVSRQQLTALGGASLLHRTKLVDLLRRVYPEEQWDEKEFASSAKKATQRFMGVCVGRLVPGVRMLEDHLVAVTAEMAEAARAQHHVHGFEVDVYLPEHNLGLEYNGVQHYEETSFFGPLEVYRRRDEEKQRLADAAGIRLISIPFWWDRKIESLGATLLAASPGLIPDSVAASLSLSSASAIPHTSPVPPTASAPTTILDGSGVDATLDPTGMLATDLLPPSAKAVLLEEQELSREGRKVPAPSAWRKQLPSDALLGRLVGPSA